MVPKTVASWVWGHALDENKANDRANSMHAVETRFVAAGRLPTIAAATYFCNEYNAPGPVPSARLGRLFCRALVRAEFLGHFHQICDRVGLHLLHHLASVCFDCFLADAEFATHLFVQKAGDHQRHDLSFPWSKRRVAVTEFLQLNFASQSEATSFKGTLDRRQQYFVIEWLGQELDSATLHRFHGLGYVTVARDEDDRNFRPFDSHSFLQFQAIETGKREVKDQTARNQGAAVIEKFLCGFEGLRLPAFVLDQQFQGLAHRDVIINDKYDRGWRRHRCEPQLADCPREPHSISPICPGYPPYSIPLKRHIQRVK